MRGLSAFVLGLFVPLVAVPLAVWWAMSVHEPYCAWGEAFWDGDLPVGEGPVRGLLLGSSRAGADVSLGRLSGATGYAWQRLARHTLTENALPPSYPELLTLSDARPGLDTLVIEVGPLLFDEVSCSRPPVPHVALQPWWFREAGELGRDDRPSALAMTILPHRWLAGSGRRHDLVDHAKDPAHLLQVLADLRHGTRGRIDRWPGEPAPPLTEENALRRRTFLLGRPMEAWSPTLSTACLDTVGRVVRAAHARRTALVAFPVRPMLRGTIEPAYREAATAAFEALAASLPATTFLDFSTRYDADEAAFNDFDHLTEAGAADFTPALAAALASPPGPAR